MTLELDTIIKNLNGRELIVELTKEDTDGTAELYIGTDNTTGACYRVQSVQEVSEMIVYYLTHYFYSDEDN